jgi:hypothetical protein
MLRFRDLITENNGTINDHLNVIYNHGEVWWGWWMKQDETPPRQLFINIFNDLEENGFVNIYLFNSGLKKIYRAKVIKILVAPEGNTIRTPDFEKSPSYYHRGSYPAWFYLNEIEETDLEALNVSIMAMPTIAKVKVILPKKIEALEELQEMNVTLWEVAKS